MALTNKTIAATYKDLLHLDNANAGLSATSRPIKDGLGNTTGLYVGQNKVKIQPTASATDSFQVCNTSGTSLLTADTTGNQIKLGTGQVNALTMYQSFIESDIQPTINTHMAISLGGSVGVAAPIGGTGTDPATSYNTSNDAYKLVDKFWYLHDNITVSGVKVYFASDHASNDTVRFHLMSYTVDSSLNLTNGEVVASGADIVNTGYEVGYTQSLTINSSDVNSGKVIMAFIRGDSINGDFHVNLNIKYNIR